MVTTAALEINGSNNKSNIRLWESATFGELSGDGGNFTGDNSWFTINQDTDTTFAGQLLDVNSARELGLIKNGSGRLTLSGQNSYELATTVNDTGTLEVSGRIGETASITVGSDAAFELTGSGSLGSGGVYNGGESGSGNIVNNGTFEYNSTTDQTLSGIISGTGDLIKTNTSTLTLTGANNYSGTTDILGGTLEIGGAGQLNSGTYAGAITNDGTLKYNSSAAQTLSGIISGTGVLVKDNTSTLHLDGRSTYSGGTTVNDGILSFDSSPRSQIGAGPLTVNGGLFSASLENVSVSALSGTGGTIEVYRRALTVNQSANTTYAGIIQNINGGSVDGNGTVFTKTGAGTLTLTGVNTYTKVTNLNGGTLLVDGALYGGVVTVESIVNVISTATLGGSGSIGGAVTVNSGGHIAPGSGSIDTLTISGGLTLNDGAVLDFEADASSCDKIDITGGTFTGAASANGVTVNVTISGGLSDQVSYTLMEWVADSGVDIADFNLVCSGGDASLSIDGSTLVLNAGPGGSLFKFR